MVQIFREDSLKLAKGRGFWEWAPKSGSGGGVSGVDP